MATNALVAQHARVPLGTLQKDGSVLITREWLRSFTLISDALNDAVTGANLTVNQVVVGAGGSAIKILPAGTNTYVLTMVAGIPTWAAGAAGAGTVTSVDVSGGTTGLTTSGGPVTTAGIITLAGTLATANGGTGLTAPGTTGNVLTSNGTVWTSAAPSAGALDVVIVQAFGC